MNNYPWVGNPSYEYRIHALQQMVSRHITRDDVLEVITSGEIIESYPDDQPHPSYLIMWIIDGRTLHVVVSYACHFDIIYIITAYEPDEQKWEDDYRRRK